MSWYHRQNDLNDDDYRDFRRRLTVMFKSLKHDHRFQFARQNFLCCQSCASYHVGTLSDERVAAGKPAITRYAFYHRQDAEGWVDGDLYIAFGDDELAGHDIRTAALDAGLAVIWDGSVNTRPRIIHPAAVSRIVRDTQARADELRAIVADPTSTDLVWDDDLKRRVDRPINRDSYERTIADLESRIVDLVVPDGYVDPEIAAAAARDLAARNASWMCAAL
jgi:hypothetical protein